MNTALLVSLAVFPFLSKITGKSQFLKKSNANRAATWEISITNGIMR
jgi:hypothetical protein